MTALVTGVAGFIGSHLAESLLDDGVGVRGVDRFSDYYDQALKRDNLELLARRDGFELVEADLNSVDIDGLLEEVDVIYHLAGQPGVRVSWGSEFEIYTRDNVLLSRQLTGLPVHAIGGVGDATTLAQLSDYDRAVRDTGSIGVSLYDYRTTTSAMWPILQ